MDSVGGERGGLVGVRARDGADGEESGLVDEQRTAPNVREGLPNQGVPFRKKGLRTMMT